MTPHRHWVSFQDGVHLSKVQKLALLQEAHLCPDGIQSRSCMTLRRSKVKVYTTLVKDDHPQKVCTRYLREDEAIIVGVPRLVRSILHGVEEKHGHDLCHAATWCGMTARKRVELKISEVVKKINKLKITKRVPCVWRARLEESSYKDPAAPSFRLSHIKALSH